MSVLEQIILVLAKLVQAVQPVQIKIGLLLQSKRFTLFSQ